MKNRPPTATLNGITLPSLTNVIVMTPSRQGHVPPVAPFLRLQLNPFIAPEGTVRVLPSHDGTATLPAGTERVPLPSAFSVNVPLNADVLIVASTTGGPAWRPVMVLLNPVNE